MLLDIGIYLFGEHFFTTLDPLMGLRIASWHNAHKLL